MSVKDRILQPRNTSGVPEVTPGELVPHVGTLTLVDVRGPDEFEGELSHVPGATLQTLGPQLDAFLETRAREEEIVFICRSGARSGRATAQALAMGFHRAVNLQGGMILWNQLSLPTQSRK